MTIMIELYIFVCVALLGFNIIFLISKNIKGHKYYPKYNRHENQIAAQIKIFQEKKELTNQFVHFLKKDIQKTSNLVFLQNIIQENSELSLAVRPYILAQLKHYQGKTSYEQSFYTYVLSTMNYETQHIDIGFAEKFVKFLDSKSLYTFTNTVGAMYRFGDVNLMMFTIDKIDQRGQFYHKKLFVDGLSTFAGDFNALSQKIMEKFPTYGPIMQENLIDCFRLNNVNVSSLCILLLENHSTAEQVKYSAMRYFGKFPNQVSKEIFWGIMADENALWVETLLAMQALDRYHDAHTYNGIKSKITDKNWHVRTNAAMYLFHQNISQEEVFTILNLKDRYANETLLYAYKNDKDMTASIETKLEELAEEKLEKEENKKQLEEIVV